eukprot:m.145789 g.145789  ORF g.145789 m.145789 type:complete len:713 (-) comp15031_c0_seq2:533-2671(-)
MEVLESRWARLERANIPELLQSAETSETVALLQGDQLLKSLVQDWCIDLAESHIRTQVIPQFWSSFCARSPMEIETFHAALQQLDTAMTSLQPFVACCCGNDPRVWQRLTQTLHVGLCTSVPAAAPTMLAALFRRVFAAFSKQFSAADKDEDEEEESEAMDAEEESAPVTEENLGRLKEAAVLLQRWGLSERLASPIVTSLLYEQAEARLAASCRDELTRPCLQRMRAWMAAVARPFVAAVRAAHDDAGWQGRLEYFIYKSFATLRIGELFDIIVDFPDSTPALDDLRECLRHTDQMHDLVTSLTAAFNKRLLHPGANTTDILAQYISSIRALKVLDSTGGLLDTVCRDVRAYLQSRSDTIRCLIESITDTHSDLMDELREGEGSGDGERSDDDWTPRAGDAGEALHSKRDVTSILVNIYGGQDRFVAEYRQLLAERLLNSRDYDIDKELRNLELLKLRFGEEALGTCDTMLKDIANSRRITTNIREGPELRDCQVDFSAFILSRTIWPALKDEISELPEALGSVFAAFTKGYTALKAARTLELRPTLGAVTLAIDLPGRTVEATVPPATAAVLMAFEDRPSWPSTELAASLKVPPPVLARRAAHWIRLGILKETGDTLVLNEESTAADGSDHEEEEAGEAAEESNAFGEMHWQYCVGMLTNFGAMNIPKILEMLNMMMADEPVSEEEAKKFLDGKVAEEQLVFSAGQYSLP